MTKILITEFINTNSLQTLKQNFEVHYNEKLWDQPEEINKFIKDCNINLKYIPVLENNKLIGIIDCLQSLQ